jgi:hypothetical protein
MLKKMKCKIGIIKTSQKQYTFYINWIAPLILWSSFEITESFPFHGGLRKQND